MTLSFFRQVRRFAGMDRDTTRLRLPVVFVGIER